MITLANSSQAPIYLEMYQQGQYLQSSGDIHIVVKPGHFIVIFYSMEFAILETAVVHCFYHVIFPTETG